MRSASPPCRAATCEPDPGSATTTACVAASPRPEGLHAAFRPDRARPGCSRSTDSNDQRRRLVIDVLASPTIPLEWGDFKWTGDFLTIDLIAAFTNALNGAIL